MQTLRILAALLEDPTVARYGFDLLEQTGLKSGTAYPILARLEQAAWIESRWEAVDPATVGRPRRRLYRLTSDGVVCSRAAVREAMRDLGAASAGPVRPTLRPGASTA